MDNAPVLRMIALVGILSAMVWTQNDSFNDSYNMNFYEARAKLMASRGLE